MKRKKVGYREMIDAILELMEEAEAEEWLETIYMYAEKIYIREILQKSREREQ